MSAFSFGAKPGGGAPAATGGFAFGAAKPLGAAAAKPALSFGGGGAKPAAAAAAAAPGGFGAKPLGGGALGGGALGGGAPAKLVAAAPAKPAGGSLFGAKPAAAAAGTKLAGGGVGFGVKPAAGAAAATAGAAATTGAAAGGMFAAGGAATTGFAGAKPAVAAFGGAKVVVPGGGFGVATTAAPVLGSSSIDHKTLDEIYTDWEQVSISSARLPWLTPGANYCCEPSVATDSSTAPFEQEDSEIRDKFVEHCRRIEVLDKTGLESQHRVRVLSSPPLVSCACCLLH